MADWQPAGGRFQAPVVALSQSPVVADTSAYNPYAAPKANVLPAAAANVQLASLGKRLGAFLLDALVGMIVFGVPYVVLMMELSAGDKSGQPPDFTPTAIGALVFLVLGGLGLLIINLVLLTTRGQSLGKMWLGIRIVGHPDAELPGFVKAVLLRAFVNGLIGAVPCLGPLYSIVDGCFVFRDDRRCIHDLIAGTQVIEGNPPKA
jgi:uncharacterized RDD family membrane protein YckC